MGRPTEQTNSGLSRDLGWLARIKNRARDNETRTPKLHAEVLEKLTFVMDVFQSELDAAAKKRRTSEKANGRAKNASAA